MRLGMEMEIVKNYMGSSAVPIWKDVLIGWMWKQNAEQSEDTEN